MALFQQRLEQYPSSVRRAFLNHPEWICTVLTSGHPQAINEWLKSRERGQDDLFDPVLREA